MDSLKNDLERLKKTNKIDGLKGAKHVGMVVDTFNQALDKKKDKEFGNEMNARNRYFVKLLVHSIESKRSGKPNEIYKSNSIIV